MRLRLILSFVTIVVVAIGSVVLIARQAAADQVRTFMFRGGSSGSEGLVHELEKYYQENGSWRGAAALLHIPGRGQGVGQGRGASQGGGLQRLQLADSDGRIVADTNDSDPSGSLTQTQLVNAIQLYDDNRLIGYLLPEGNIAFSEVDESRLVARINQAALTAGLVAGGVSLLLALLLAYSLLRPVRELTQAADEMSRGDLSQRVQVRGNDELAMLGNTFNEMADSLQDAEESRREMTADIAHELRNPLAVQRAHLEAIQDGIYPMSSESLAPVLEQNRQLSRLVEDLRTLSLTDTGQLELIRAPTDLDQLIRRSIERYAPQAMEHGIILEYENREPSESANLTIDGGRIEQVLTNLLSNALRYTPENGSVQVSLKQATNWVEISVRDSGPGIKPEALDRVFERFYRGDRSRSRAEGGSGLGLAIARKLAEAHSGTISAENHPDGGAVFTLRLPRQHG